MNKKIINKLVRDNIPNIIKSEGRMFETKVLKQQEYENLLKKKLVEESNEVLQASEEEIMDELADVLQLVYSISSAMNVDISQIEKLRIKKEKLNGGFSKKLFLVWTESKEN